MPIYNNLKSSKNSTFSIYLSSIWLNYDIMQKTGSSMHLIIGKKLQKTGLNIVKTRVLKKSEIYIY